VEKRKYDTVGSDDRKTFYFSAMNVPRQLHLSYKFGENPLFDPFKGEVHIFKK